MIPHLPTDEAPPFSWRPFVIAAGVVALVVAAGFFVVAPDIRARENVRTRERLATCRMATAREIADVAPRLRTEGGRFVRWIGRSEGADVFVSAEFRDRRLARGADGDVATWLVRRDGSATAAEPVAEKRSSWAPSARTKITREQAFLDSRFCVVKLRQQKWQTEFAKEAP